MKLQSSWKPFTDCTGVTITYDGTQSFEEQIKVRVESGNPPDIALFPQPGLMSSIVASSGLLIPAPPEVAAQVDAYYSPAFKDYGTDPASGIFFAPPMDANVKSFVWYSPTKFKEKGYEVPQTYEELVALSDKIVADGGKPWCAGIFSDAATGWPATDWLEDFMLRCERARRLRPVGNQRGQVQRPIALLGASLATRAASNRRTFGLQRAEVLAALANALLLVAVSVWVLIQAVDRFRRAGARRDRADARRRRGRRRRQPGRPVDLARGQAESLNVRGAYLEVLGDLVGSVAVIVAAILIMLTGWTRFDADRLAGHLRADPAAGLVAAPRRGRRAARGHPTRGRSGRGSRSTSARCPACVAVHDLHAWTITSGVPVLSAHVVVDDACIDRGPIGQVLDRLGECLQATTSTSSTAPSSSSRSVTASTSQRITPEPRFLASS